jgi:tetratricopeptide (TPR) repeat protein
VYVVRNIITGLLVLFILPVSGQQTDYLQRIVQLKNQPESVQKHLKLAEIYSETGDYKQAIYHYEKLVATDTSISYLKLLAGVYEKYGRDDKAILVRERIDRADSLQLLNRYKLALLYARNLQKQKAVALLNILEKTDTLNPEYSYKIGLYEKKLDHKLNAFLRAYRKDTAHIKTIYMLVKYYKKIQFIDSADYYINKGLKLYPANTKLLRQKVINDYRQHRYKEMLNGLQKLDSLQYDRLFVYKNLGLVYLMLNRLDSAKSYLDKAFTEDFRDASVNYYLGLWYFNKKKYKIAETKFKYAIHLKTPDLDNEFYQLGLLAKEQKRYKEAIDWFKKSFKNNPSNRDALWQLAILSEVYYKDLTIAIDYYELFLERFKDSPQEQIIFIKHKLSQLKQQVFLKK